MRRFESTLILASCVAIGILGLIGIEGARAQTSSPVPTVLGCNNPAPAAPGKPTVFISKCITPQFVPVTSSSVVASGSKLAPLWLHSFSYYAANAPGTLLVACPQGANITAGQCADATGKDLSAVIPASAVAAFTMPPPPAVCPETIIPLDWHCGKVVNGVLTCTAPVTQ